MCSRRIRFSITGSFGAITRIFVLGTILLPGSGIAAAQTTRPTVRSDPDTPIGVDPEEFRQRKELFARLRRGQRSEKQQSISKDAARLVECTKEYQRSLQEHAEPVDADRKLLKEIEKLARRIRETTRDLY